MSDIDYSVYLVTGRELLPPGKDYYESLEESLQGGVTLVQIREKHADTGEFIEIAARSKEICDRYNVPLIINDRVDVAIAVNARGVHLGQTDMSVAQARELLPEGTVIGVSCNNVGHVRTAIKDGADSIGIGAVWGTQTKQLTSPLVGVRGVGGLLELLDGTNIRAVAIGGMKAKNLLRTLHGSVSKTGHALDGVAIVSEIMASRNPRQAAATLSTIFKSFTISLPPAISPRAPLSGQALVERVAHLMSVVREVNPLVHQITNTVVATQSANITLSLGGSPIMASEPQEMEDLSRISSALLINIGTMRSDGKESMSKAGYFANENKKPLVFDPVGIGASALRKETVKDLLNVFQASVIKGNAGELAALANSQEVCGVVHAQFYYHFIVISSQVLTKGVDSVGPGFKDPVSFVRDLAKKERCVIALTGPVDYVSDGTNVVALRNGHEILGKITGSGCIVGSSIATYCGALFARCSADSTGKLVQGDTFLGAVAGVMVLTVAAEVAVRRADVKGPGTFLPALIDELWALQSSTVQSLARIESTEIRYSMPSLTIIIEENSPLITYDSGWDLGTSSDDPLLDRRAILLVFYAACLTCLLRRYSDSGFMKSNIGGSSASFTFNGTGVEIFGAKRGNHGPYTIKVDNTTYPAQNGSVPDPGLFQQSLFLVNGLQQGQHEVTITNGGNTYVDIDYISWVADVGGSSDKLFVNTFQDTDPSFVFSGSAWQLDPNADRFIDGSAQYVVHIVKTPGVALSCQ
ncbi:hypothetical protein C0995_004278 [Termitomyces sp. Mi166|nr:hypothetical protein C0995_004278 [Termitomyces sp. Mi166\